jgi:GNAT superfamily N-acetyltransferase
MSRIDCIPLSAIPETAPLLARWFMSEWTDHYAGRTLAEVQADFPIPGAEELPLILVAVSDGRPCGTAALRTGSIRTFSHFTPWLGGLYVEPSSRRLGVATSLIGAVSQAARARAAPALYAGTTEAHALFDALAWRRVAETIQDGAPVTVYETPL